MRTNVVIAANLSMRDYYFIFCSSLLSFAPFISPTESMSIATSDLDAVQAA
jgi:hypothetical protein